MKNLKLLSAGVVAWIIGITVLYFLAWLLVPVEGVPSALMWALSYWWVAYTCGLIVLLATAAFWKVAPWRALGAYLGPVALITIVAGLCLLVYPSVSFREELMGYLPVSVVFYALGLAWAYLRREAAHVLTRAILIPAFGGLLILGFVAVPTFTGNAFLYRDAFSLQVLSIERTGSSIGAECILEIRKPGSYVFAAPALYFFEIMMDQSDEVDPPGKIVWGSRGEPQEGDSGKFPLTIRYEMVPEGDFWPGMEFGSSSIVIEVRDANERDRTLRTIAAMQSPAP
jgi:hypothetical protein